MPPIARRMARRSSSGLRTLLAREPPWREGRVRSKLNVGRFSKSVGESHASDFRGLTMAEVASFGNIVNSLLALRQDYHEQLKSIPQYEAYLLVESSTEK